VCPRLRTVRSCTPRLALLQRGEDAV